MKLVFVSGPYRGKDFMDIERNIQNAQLASMRLWRQGYAVFCPHLNSAHFDGLVPDETFLAGDIEILGRCDCIFMLKNWQDSVGARAEYQYAIEHRLEVMSE